MGFLGSSILAASSPTVTTISNETIAAANTEQSFALPSDCKEFILKTRSGATLLLAYVATGTTTSRYVTIEARAVYVDSALYSSQTLYFQSPTMGEIVEIIQKV